MAAIRMTDFAEFNYAVKPHLVAKCDRSAVYRSRHGLIEVFADAARRAGPLRFSGFTSLSMIYGGRNYYRSWKRDWPPRTIARLAREFADSVAGTAR